MLTDTHAAPCDVETGALNRVVKRNLDHFPPDFMFQLSAGRRKLEMADWHLKSALRPIPAPRLHRARRCHGSGR